MGGEGKDWIELMTQTRPRKEDVIRNLLESTKQPVDKKKESKGPVPTKKPNASTWREKATLEIKGDNKTILHWITRQDENEDRHS